MSRGRLGAILVAALAAAPTARAATPEPPRAEFERVLKTLKLPDLRSWRIADSSRDGWRLSVEFAPRQIEPGLCVFSGTSVYVSQGPSGLSARSDPPDDYAAFASCDRVGGSALETIVLGGGPADIPHLAAVSHALARFVGVRPLPGDVVFRFDTPRLRGVLARARLERVFMIAPDGGDGALVYLFAPGTKKPLGLQLTLRGNSLAAVYVFVQTMPLAD